MPVTNPTATTGESSPDSKVGIDYAVSQLEGDIQESGDPSTSGLTALLTVDAADSVAFLYELLGYSELDGTSLHRVLPEPSGIYSDMYAASYQRVKSIWDQGTNAAGWPTYDQITYAVTYVKPLYEVLEDDEVTYEHERFCVWRKKIAAQNEKIPGGTFKTIATPSVVLYEVGVRTGRTLELTCKWIDVPKFDYATISGLANKINDADVTWDGTVYDAETVLFTGAEEEPRLNAFGLRTRDITFSFLIRADGRSWNKFWSASDGDYIEVSTDGTSGGDKPFGAADLNTLWTFS